MVLQIRKIREQAEKTQIELAKAVGCSNVAVCRWESGDTLPTVDKLPLIATALNCTIDELFSVGDNTIVPENEV